MLKLYKAGVREGESQEITPSKWSDWSKSRMCMSNYGGRGGGKWREGLLMLDL